MTASELTDDILDGRASIEPCIMESGKVDTNDTYSLRSSSNKPKEGKLKEEEDEQSSAVLTNTNVCDICGYAVAPACDLKEHMKRYEQQYGCIYPKCYKRFCTKSNWVRYEKSQHFQLRVSL